MIDLHLHTNASDGLYGPDELLRRARDVGLRIVSVTDHDTMAGVPGAMEAAADCGLHCVAGIEITAVLGARDVHILGYFLDPASIPLRDFLASLRADRIRRARQMAERLASVGCPIDIDTVLRDVAADPDRAVARPRIAVELLRAGHVDSLAEAFDRLIGEGRPAYVPRSGATPREVVSLIRSAGGVAALAHPGLLRQDDLIPELVDAGMAAIEVYHGDHDEATQARYAAVARQYDLVMTGGSDYHGEGLGRHAALGTISVPAAEFERLRARANDHSA